MLQVRPTDKRCKSLQQLIIIVLLHLRLNSRGRRKNQSRGDCDQRITTRECGNAVAVRGGGGYPSAPTHRTDDNRRQLFFSLPLTSLPSSCFRPLEPNIPIDSESEIRFAVDFRVMTDEETLA